MSNNCSDYLDPIIRPKCGTNSSILERKRARSETVVPSASFRVSTSPHHWSTGVPRSQETAPPLGPYSRTMPKAVWWSQRGGAVYYERGTPANHPFRHPLFLRSRRIPVTSSADEGNRKRRFGPARKVGEKTHREMVVVPRVVLRNMAHLRQSRPDSGRGFQSDVLQTIEGSWLGGGP